MDEQDIRGDFARFSNLSPPVKRAAYSDRTAWLMAILSELAYTPFDEEDEGSLLSLAADLANLTNQGSIAEKLKAFERTFSGPGRPAIGGANDALRDVLALGGFELKGVLFDSGTDTQGFVAVRRVENDVGMAVISFRGIEPAQIHGWIVNFDAAKAPIRSARPGSMAVLGNVHRGFNKAFKSVEGQILESLRGDENLPLYITGHSLGGALATLATWYLSRDSLAACYTFGAPRVGDRGLMDHYRTPIYRVVNGADPVPMVPPSDKVVKFFKHAARFVGMLVLKETMDKVVGYLIRYQGFRHYGYQRYLSMCEAGPKGDYPALSNEYGIKSFERLWRCVSRAWLGIGQRKRLDRYHDMSLYRAKLRAYAIRRQGGVR